MNEQRSFGVEMETLSKQPLYWVAEQLNAVLAPFGHVASQLPYSHNTNSQNRTHWHCKPDGSLEPRGSEYRYGCEIVTPVLYGEQGLEVLKAVCTWLVASRNFKVNSSCGLHVHHGVSARELTPLAKTWVRIEKVVIGCLPATRKGNKYCKAWFNLMPSGCETMLAEMPAMQWFERYVGHTNRNGSRYCTLNYVSYSLRGTVEFRCAAGSFEYEKISNWVLCTQAIIENARNVPAQTVATFETFAAWLQNGQTNVPASVPVTTETVFGNHRRGTASAMVDEMLRSGVHLHEAVARLQAAFANYANAPKTAERKFKGHVTHLLQHNVNIQRTGTYYVYVPASAPAEMPASVPVPASAYSNAVAWLQTRYAQFSHVAPIYNY